MISCTRLPNYTIGTFLKSVSVPWNSIFRAAITALHAAAVATNVTDTLLRLIINRYQAIHWYRSSIHSDNMSLQSRDLCFHFRFSANLLSCQFRKPESGNVLSKYLFLCNKCKRGGFVSVPCKVICYISLYISNCCAAVYRLVYNS